MKESGFETIFDDTWLPGIQREDWRTLAGECESCDNEPGCDCDNPCYKPDCD